MFVAASLAAVSCDTTGVSFSEVRLVEPNEGAAELAGDVAAEASGTIVAAGGGGGVAGSGSAGIVTRGVAASGGAAGDEGRNALPPPADGGTPPSLAKDDPDPGGSGDPSPSPAEADDSCGAECAGAGGSCFEGTCFFDCGDPGSCSTAIVQCPREQRFNVQCGDGSCSWGVVCGEHSDCDVVCDVSSVERDG